MTEIAPPGCSLKLTPVVLRMVLFGSLALSALACSGDDPRGSASGGGSGPVPGGTLRIAVKSDIQGVNELIARDVQTTQDVLEQLFLELGEERADFASGPPSFEPEFAESWEFSPDRRELVFRLRPEVRWSDGTPVTASDVVYTWRAQVAPELAWARADEKGEIERVEEVDARTVRFRFRSVYPQQLLNAIDGRILPAAAWSPIPFAEWRTAGDRFRERLVTSGPFRLEQWEPMRRIVLARNPAYFESGRPYLDRVELEVVPDASSRIERLLQGSVDYLPDVQPGDLARIEGRSDLAVVSGPGLQFEFVGWNTARPPLDRPEVRRALTLGIDRQELADVVWKGRARVGVSAILQSTWAHDSALSPWPYDPEAARRLLAEQGWGETDGEGYRVRAGKRLRLEILTNSSNRLRSDALVLIQEQLRRIGVEVLVRQLEVHTVIERAGAGDFDGILLGWGVPTGLDVTPFFHSDPDRGGYNWGRYKNPEVDRLLDGLKGFATAEETLPSHRRIEAILHEEQPYTFLVEPERFGVIRTAFRGVAANALSPLYRLQDWWYQPAGEGAR